MKRLLAVAIGVLPVIAVLMLLAPWSATAAPAVAPTITAQPDMALVEQAGDGTQFTAQAAGTPAPSVRWQVATDRNGPWTDIGGNDSETSTTLVLQASADNLGDAYRAVFTNSAGSATSRPAKLVSRMDWMYNLGSDIANVPLNELTIPGAHDMGTYGFSHDAGDSLDGQLPQIVCDIVSQSVCVSYGRAQDPSKRAAEELTDGIRYFDLRVCGNNTSDELDLPEDWEDFSQDPITCHGLEGAQFADILSDTRTFALAHPHEVVILDVNHEYQVDINTLATQIEQAFALPDGGSLMIKPQYCTTIDDGECASQLTLGKIWAEQLGNVIVNFENDGAPGSTQGALTSSGEEEFNLQEVPNYAFYDLHPLLWGRLNGAPNSMEFCTESSATASCFGNNSDRYAVLSRVLNTLATRSTFTDTRQFFIQFLQTTPDTGYIVDNLTRSLVDMADDDDIGSNPIIGPWLFDCGSGVNTCFAAVRPENMNILAINFYNHTEFGVNAMSQAEDAACVDGQGTCDLSAAEQQTISFAVPSCQQGAQPRLCTYLAPLTFDFIDQVVRFDEYARTAPVVNVTAPVAPASTGWYNAATLGGPGNALTVDVNVSDYRYPTGISALSCLDGAAAFAVAPSAPPTDSSEQATGALTDGVHQIACQGTDGADQGFNEQGNEGAGPGSQQSVSFQIDTHPPTVTFSGDSGSYGILANVAISCTAADTLSGVASTTCPTTSGPGWSFGAGPHVLNATATDKAGNVGSGSANFTITVTAADIDTLTHQFAHGAAQYKVLPAFMKAIADLVISANDLPLKAIGPKTTAAQKHALISAYDQGIQTLAKQGWLTTAQAATLVGLAAAL